MHTDWQGECKLAPSGYSTFPPPFPSVTVLFTSVVYQCNNLPLLQKQNTFSRNSASSYPLSLAFQLTIYSHFYQENIGGQKSNLKVIQKN